MLLIILDNYAPRGPATGWVLLAVLFMPIAYGIWVASKSFCYSYIIHEEEY